MYNHSVHLLRYAFLIGAFLLFPTLSHAAQITTWDFRGNVPGKWDASSTLEIQGQPYGLEIVASGGDGAIQRTVNLEHRVHDVLITTSAASDTEAILLWHVRGTPDGDFVRLPFTIPASLSPIENLLDVSRYKQWDPRADAFGILLPSGAHIVIHDMQFIKYNPFERLGQAFLSFWQPDSLANYSINFLWGPLLTFTPAGRISMFDRLPPAGWSVMRVIYPFFLIVIAGTLYAARRRKIRSGIMCFFAVFAGVWIFLDARMTMEIINYARNDWAKYISQEPGDKNLRGLAGLYDSMDYAAKRVQPNERVGVLYEPNLPLYSFFRYGLLRQC